MSKGAPIVATATDFGDRRCRRQDRRAAEAVADQQLGRRRAIPQGVGCGHQILDVRGEGRARELAGTGAQPGEVEAQGGDPQLGEAAGELGRGPHVLAAGEAVGEQRVGDGLRIGQLQQAGQPVAAGTDEIEALLAHRLSLRLRMRVVGGAALRRQALRHRS